MTTSNAPDAAAAAIEPPVPDANGATLRAEEAPVPIRRAYGYWLLTLFVIFSSALVSGSWYGWILFKTNAERIDGILATQRADQDALGQSLHAVQSEIAQVHTQIESERETARAALTKAQSANQANQQALSAQMGQVEQKLAGIQDRLGRGELAWQAADIGFLLTRAEERLSIAQDPAGAATALRLADQRLAAVAQPQVLPVRAAISDALSGLQKADAFDSVGMALRLRRAADQVPAWPLTGSRADSPVSAAQVRGGTSASEPPPSADEPWYIRWPQAVWHPVADWLGRQITLTRSNAPLKASARAATDRETLIWLTAVRESLLARDVPMLEESIVQAQAWIGTHYSPQAQDVRAAQDALRATQDFYATRRWPSLAPIFKTWQAAGLAAPTQTTGPESAALPEAQP